MSKHLEREMSRLERQMLALSAVVEENLLLALKSLKARDVRGAENVVKRDSEVDAIEVELEEECLKILALYQPVATDLRSIVSILKINNDLERVGDLAVAIARSSIRLGSIDPVPIPSQIERMGELTLTMFRECLHAFVRLDGVLARTVVENDQKVDDLRREVRELVEQTVRREGEKTAAFINILRIAESLERVGDHASNIAEDIIYMLEGGIVRHK